MIKKYKNIFTLKSKEVMDFFLKSEQFHGFELPEYFNFDKVLKAVAKSVGNKSYDECLGNVLPDELSDVNLDILLNKDGHYAVRPIILANPFLYYFLVREVCNPKGGKPFKIALASLRYRTLHHVHCQLCPIKPSHSTSRQPSSTGGILSSSDRWNYRSSTAICSSPTSPTVMAPSTPKP